MGNTTTFKKGSTIGEKTRFKNGQISPRKGVKLSEVTKLRISLAKRGLSTEHLKEKRVYVKHTAETKNKISIAHKGMKKPWAGQKDCKAETKLKISIALKGVPRPDIFGEKHPNWKGGVSSVNARERNSIEYKKWRESIFKRDNYTCKECKQRGGKLNAHHKKSFAKFPQLRYKLSNGVTLCEPCHEKTDNYKNKKNV